MNILKQNLKRLINLFLLLILSCTTLEIEEVTSYKESKVTPEFRSIGEDLPEIDPLSINKIVEFRDYEYKDIDRGHLLLIPEVVSSRVKSYIKYSEKELTSRSSPYNLEEPVALAYERPEIEMVVDSSYDDSYEVLPRSLDTPLIIKIPNKRVETIKKPIKKASIPVKAPKEKKIVTEKKVTVDKKVINMPEKEVLLGNSFTIEMDLTGWLFEKELDEIEFLNKFYTSNSVIFEFRSLKAGKVDVEFSNYKSSEKETAIIPLLIVTKTRESVNIRENIKSSVVVEHLSTKERLEKRLKNIDSDENPDEVYYKLGNIYYDEGLIKMAKEFFEYVYDNYPLSSYYESSVEKMNYIIDNFLQVR